MKLSIITDEFTQDLDTAIAFAHAYQLQGLELRTLENRPLEDFSASEMRAIYHHTKEEGLEIANLASSFYKCRYEDRQDEIEKLKRLLEAADILNCSILRGFAFFADPSLSDAHFIEAFEPVIALLKDAGKTLLLEADPSVTTTNHGQLCRLLELLNSPQLGAIYDPGNDIYDPQGEIPYPDGWRMIQPYVKHVHIKDAVMTPGGPECVRIGDGLVDYIGLCKALKVSGYAGYLSLETHYRKGQGVISEEAMRLPGGASFSDGGLSAAAESAEALKRLWEVSDAL